MWHGDVFTNIGNWIQVSSEVISLSWEYVNRLLLNKELTEHSNDVDYDDTIQELYVNATVEDEFTLSIKYYEPTGNLYLRPFKKDGTYQWQAVVNISSWVNNKVYELKCTSAGDGINVGDIVGYIVFKNIEKFKNNSYTGYGIPIYYPFVRNLSNFPQISLYVNGIPTESLKDNAVTSEKIADNAVTSEKIAGRNIFMDANNNYVNNVLELWIDPKYKDDTEGIAYYFKIYNNSLYVRPYVNGQLPYIWNAIAALPDKDAYNGEPIEVVANVAGGDVSVGDTIGYVVFANTNNWEATDGGIGEKLSGQVFNIGSFPTIYSKVQNDKTGKQIKDIDGQVENIKNNISEKLVTMENGVEVVLPDTIKVTAGDRLELFHRSCIRCVNPYNYHIVVLCPIGQNYPRYYCLNATQENVDKEYLLELQVKRNDGSIVASGQTTIKVIPVMSQPSSNRNILCVGASATAGGQWAGEVKRRLTETSGDGTPFNPKGLGLSNITFVGRKTGTVNSVKLEATGGWTWDAFAGQGRPAYRFQVSGVSQLNMNDTYSVNGVTLTITEINVTEDNGNIRCTYSGSNEIPASGTLVRATGSGDETITYTQVESESYNPFWNNGKLDFLNYANLYCDGSIDVLITHLGVNDIFAGRSAETLIESYVKPFVRAFHMDFPNGKLIISTLPLPDCAGGMAANYGATEHNYYHRAQYFWDYAKAFDELSKDSEFSPYLSVATVIQEFDCEYSYPKTDAAVNNRSEIKEKLGTNGVHPANEGYYLIADAIFREINSLQL